MVKYLAGSCLGPIPLCRVGPLLGSISLAHQVIIFGFFNEGESFDDSEPTTTLYHAMTEQLRRQGLAFHKSHVESFRGNIKSMALEYVACASIRSFQGWK